MTQGVEWFIKTLVGAIATVPIAILIMLAALVLNSMLLVYVLLAVVVVGTVMLAASAVGMVLDVCAEVKK